MEDHTTPEIAVSAAQPLRAVLFDLDGTLVDSFQGIAATVDATLAHYGWPPGDRALLQTLIGRPLSDIFALLLANGESPVGVAPRMTAAGSRATGPAFETYVSKYRELYPTLGIPRTPLYPGIGAVLRACVEAHLRLALVTTKRTDVAREVLAAVGIEGLFTAVIGGDGAPFPKPHPAPVLAALEMLNLTPGEAVIVGDTTFDMEMARGAGCRAVGVCWGNHPPESLLASGASALAHRADELVTLLGLTRQVFSSR